MRVTQASAHSIPENEIIARIQSGETGLYELFVNRYNSRLLRASRRIVRNDADVEDIVQQTHLKAFFHLSQFRGQSSFSTWLITIATNEALLHLRRRPRAQEWVDFSTQGDDGLGDVFRTIKSPARGPEDQAANLELQKELRTAIASLPHRYRTVFLLREVEQLDTREVVNRLGLTEACVKSRLKRAKNMLRDRLRVWTVKTSKFNRPTCRPNRNDN